MHIIYHSKLLYSSTEGLSLKDIKPDKNRNILNAIAILVASQATLPHNRAKNNLKLYEKFGKFIFSRKVKPEITLGYVSKIVDFVLFFFSFFFF